MQPSSWLLVAIAALVASNPSVVALRDASAVLLASTSQCSSVDTCYEGGASSTPCKVSSGGCPPCVTFSDKGCYVKVNSACPFGVDCTSVWGGSTTSSSSNTSSTTTSSSGTSTSTSTSSSTTTPSSSSTTSSSTGTTAGTSSKSVTDTSGKASSSTASSASGSSSTSTGQSSSGGSDMSVVFAIIGAAIGVIAVAVIFLTLVRRSRAAREEEEDDDMANTPPAFSKNPVVQGAASYSSYGGSNRAAGIGSGGAGEIGLDMSKGVSMNAVSYYNQQPPQNSTAPSPHVAGRAIPSQPVGMNPSAGVYGTQNYGQMGASGVNPMAVSGGSARGASGVGSALDASGASQAPPAPVQHLPMGGVAPSPHTRRESFEF